MRRAFEWGFYPTILIGSVVLTWALLRAGVPHPLVAAALPFGFAALYVYLESLFPEHAPWVTTWRTTGTDLLHAVFSNALPGAVGKLFVLWLALQIPHSTGVWERMPYLVQLALAVVAADFVFYWCHRFLHTVPAIWRWHAIHHRSEQMYSLAALTNHPVQVIFAYTLEVALLVAIGVPDEILVAQGVFKTVHGVLQHSNLPMRFGYLNLIFSTPELHRWHHHREIRESNANYGNTTAVWDHVFGSRNHEWDRPMPRNLGLPPDITIGPGFWDQMIAPFQWGWRFPTAAKGWRPLYPTTKRGFIEAERAARGD